jgi:hypothetical protein
VKLTEEDAREKWCPFARADAYPASESSVTVNREGSSFTRKACLCIASNCMAWRWAEEKSVTDRRGYCGLAGGNV